MAVRQRFKMNNTVTEAALKGIRTAPTFAAAAELTAGLMKRLEFADELLDAPRAYHQTIETTAGELTNLIRSQQIVPAELAGENLAKLLAYLQDNIPCALETEINDRACEWLMIQQELAASAAKQMPPHLNMEDGFLEMQYEDRFEMGVD